MPGKSNRWLLLLLALPFLFSGCGESGNKQVRDLVPPDSLIGREQMILILSDLHLIESGLQLKKNRGMKSDSLEQVWRNGILRKYRISSARFRENLEYYRRDKDGFIELYEAVVRRLDAMGTSMPDPRKTIDH